MSVMSTPPVHVPLPATWYGNNADMFHFHLSQVAALYGEQFQMTQNRQEEYLNKCVQVYELQSEVDMLRSQLATVHAGPGHVQAALVREPYKSTMGTGAKWAPHWARLAQALWHSDDAITRVGLVKRASSINPSVKDSLDLICNNPSVQDALGLISVPHDAIQAAHAHELIKRCATPLANAALWRSAAAALRNNLTLRLCCQRGSCDFATFEAEVQRIYGPGRVGTQGFDLDLRSQLFNSYEHLFPGFREVRKRKRVKKHRKEQREGSPTETQEHGPVEEEHDSACDDPPAPSPEVVAQDDKVRQIHYARGRWWEDRHTDSEDGLSQGGDSVDTTLTWPQRTKHVEPRHVAPPFVGQRKHDGSSNDFLGKLRSEMPSVAEECETPTEFLVAAARSSVDDPTNKLPRILACLQLFDNDFVGTLRPLLMEFKSQAFFHCCDALVTFATEQQTRSSDAIELFLLPLSASSDDDVRMACLRRILQICRNLEGVLSLPGGRAAKMTLSREVRDQMAAQLKLEFVDNETEEVAIRIFARAFPFHQLFDIIDHKGSWLMEVALSEIFYTLERPIQLSWDDDCSKVDKDWASNLLKDISQQRKDVSDSRCQLAWVRTAPNHDKKSDYLILLGLLFPQAMLVDILEKAVETQETDLTGCSCVALQSINDNLEKLSLAERDRLARLVVQVEMRTLRRYCRTDLISMAGSIMQGLEEELVIKVLTQITECGIENQDDRNGESFDYAVVWSLSNFIRQSPAWPSQAVKDRSKQICTSLVEKWRDDDRGDAGKTCEIAKLMLSRDF